MPSQKKEKKEKKRLNFDASVKQYLVLCKLCRPLKK